MSLRPGSLCHKIPTFVYDTDLTWYRSYNLTVMTKTMCRLFSFDRESHTETAPVKVICIFFRNDYVMDSSCLKDSGVIVEAKKKETFSEAANIPTPGLFSAVDPSMAIT